MLKNKLSHDQIKADKDDCNYLYKTVIEKHSQAPQQSREVSSSVAYISGLSLNILTMFEYIPEKITPKVAEALVMAIQNIEKNAMLFKEKNYQDYNFSFKEFPPKNTRTKAIEPCQFYFKVEDNSVFYAFRKAKGGIFRGSFSATDFPNLELFKNFYSLVRTQAEASQLSEEQKEVFYLLLSKQKINNDYPKNFLIENFKKTLMSLQVIIDWGTQDQNCSEEYVQQFQSYAKYIEIYMNKLADLGVEVDLDYPRLTVATFFEEAADSYKNIILKTRYQTQARFYGQQERNRLQEVAVIPPVGEAEESKLYQRAHEPLQKKVNNQPLNTIEPKQPAKPSPSRFSSLISGFSALFYSSSPAPEKEALVNNEEKPKQG